VDLRRPPEDDEQERDDAVPDVRRTRRRQQAADIDEERHPGRDGHHARQDDGVGDRLGEIGHHERDADVEEDTGRTRDGERIGAAGGRIRETADEADDAEHPGVEEPPDRRHPHRPDEDDDRADDCPPERADHRRSRKDDDAEEGEAHPVAGERDEGVRQSASEQPKQQQRCERDDVGRGQR